MDEKDFMMGVALRYKVICKKGPRSVKKKPGWFKRVGNGD